MTVSSAHAYLATDTHPDYHKDFHFLSFLSGGTFPTIFLFTLNFIFNVSCCSEFAFSNNYQPVYCYSSANVFLVCRDLDSFSRVLFSAFSQFTFVVLFTVPEVAVSDIK